MNTPANQPDELIRMTPTEAVAGLKKGDLSPSDLLDALASRIEQVDDQVNALPIRFFDEARKEAQSFDARKHENKDRPGFLAGLPVAIKDYNSVAGQLTTYGSPIFAENRAEKSDNMVSTIQASGGIAYAKSNVPEIAGANTFNPVFGATRNPWNLGRTVGGSSGGAAASLASGTAWLATGNDLGGSLRIPASYCGIVGLRPSVGRVPRVVDLPYDALWVEGPMARNVPDLALMLDAMAHGHPADPISFPAPARPFVEAVRNPETPARIGFTSNLGLSLVDPEVEKLCRAGTDAFTAMGSKVDDTCPDFTGGIDAFQTLRAILIASLRGELLDTHRDQIAPEIIWNIEKGQNVTADQILSAERSRAKIFNNMVRFFETHDILACPTVAVPPYPVEERFPTKIGDQELTSYIDWMYLTFVITLTGCPAISVPCGFTSEGLPVGLQLIGRPKGDFDLISAAALLEQALDLSAQLPVTPKS